VKIVTQFFPRLDQAPSRWASLIPMDTHYGYHSECQIQSRWPIISIAI